METIQITPSTRLVVTQDVGAECPRSDWHMLTGFVKIPGYGFWDLEDVPAVHQAPIPIQEAYAKTYHFPDMERWARVFHGLVIKYDNRHGGFWFVAGADAATYATPVDAANRALFRDNWPDLEPGTPEHLARQEEVIAQEREVYRQWADGEVYTVELQRARTLAPVQWNEAGGVWDLVDPLTDADMTKDWEEVDSIGGNYLNDDYTAVKVALECFDLTNDESAALADLIDN